MYIQCTCITYIVYILYVCMYCMYVHVCMYVCTVCMYIHVCMYVLYVLYVCTVCMYVCTVCMYLWSRVVIEGCVEFESAEERLATFLVWRGKRRKGKEGIEGRVGKGRRGDQGGGGEGDRKISMTSVHITERFVQVRRLVRIHQLAPILSLSLSLSPPPPPHCYLADSRFIGSGILYPVGLLNLLQDHEWS